MSADQPDDPTVIDRPPNAGEGRPIGSPGSVITVEDARTEAIYSFHSSGATKQAVLQETRIVVLRSRIAALEETLEAERDRRRALVNRYERILRERDQTENESDDEASLIDRFRQAFSP